MRRVGSAAQHGGVSIVSHIKVIQNEPKDNQVH